MHARTRTVAARVLLGVGVALVATTWLAPWSWTAELLASFRPHLAVLVLVLAFAALLLRRPLPALGLLVAAVLCALPVVQVSRGEPAPAEPGIEPLVLAQVNSQGGFGSTRQILDYLGEQPVDVLVVLDPAPDWGSFLRGPVRLVGYEQVFPATGLADDDVLVLSRVPLSDVQLPSDEDLPPSSIELTAPLGDGEVHVLATHASDPRSPASWAQRNRELAAIAEWSHGRDDVVVMGDLNTTPWSPTFHRFEADSGLVSSGEGRPTQASWPRGSWWEDGLGIPIDHLLHSPDLTTVERRLDPSLGSEHAVLVAALAPAA